MTVPFYLCGPIFGHFKAELLVQAIKAVKEVDLFSSYAYFKTYALLRLIDLFPLTSGSNGFISVVFLVTKTLKL